MKDAEDALAAMEHSVTDREKDIQAIRTVCRQAKPGKPGAERRPGLHRRSGGQQLQPPGPRLGSGEGVRAGARGSARLTGRERGGAAPSPLHRVRGPKALRHSGWPGHVLRQNSGRSARAIRADRQSFAPLLPISVRHSGWPGHVRRQNMGRSALAIRAVRQSLGGLPLISVRHSGWPGHVLRQNSGRSARAIRAVRQSFEAFPPTSVRHSG